MWIILIVNIKIFGQEDYNIFRFVLNSLKRTVSKECFAWETDFGMFFLSTNMNSWESFTQESDFTGF